MQAFHPLKKKFEDYLFAQQFTREPASLYDPFAYMFSIGGKRIRPVLLLASTQLLNGKIEEALPTAFAIELFHNFSLMHDDIMDEADLRRGKQTVHKKFGTNTAILSGDVMFVYAYEYLSKTYRKQTIELFNQTAKEVCEGQQLDMEFETKFDVTPQQYIEMITLKTGVLLGCSLQLGAIVANSSNEIQQALYQFGKQLGISFQIKDDLLDTYAQQKEFGKQIGGDILQNKRTYLLLHCLENSAEQNKEKLLQWLKTDHFSAGEKIAEIKQLYDLTGTREATEQMADSFYEKSIHELEQLESLGVQTDLLHQFAQQLLQRKT